MKIKKYTRLLMAILGFLIITVCSKNNFLSKKIEPISRTEFLMDTVMTVKIYDKANKQVLDNVFNRLKEIEDRMSVTIDTSDVSKINENAGIKPVTVNKDTYFVIKEAKKYAEISSGAYDPTIGPLVDLWNIKSEENERTSIPSLVEINEKKSLINYKNLELLEYNQIFLKEKNMKINLGSIVKGYATDEVKKILIENGINSAIIDLGGNVFALGSKTEGIPWTIGVQNPLEYTGSYLGLLKINTKSIVTSGDYERYFEYKGKKYHHILDTKTGYPVENELHGVSIISDNSIDGDALSTTLFALGLDKGMKLAQKLNNIDVIFITKDKTVYIPLNLHDSFSLKEGISNFTIKEY